MAILNHTINYNGIPTNFTFHRGAPLCLEIHFVTSKQTKIAVNVKPTSEIEISLSPCTTPCTNFRGKLLWVNMPRIDDHDWNDWLNRKEGVASYDFYAFSSTGGSVKWTDLRSKAENFDLQPIFCMYGLNMDGGCLVFGATLMCEAKLEQTGGVKGNQNSGIHKFSFKVWEDV